MSSSKQVWPPIDDLLLNMHTNSVDLLTNTHQNKQVKLAWRSKTQWCWTQIHETDKPTNKAHNSTDLWRVSYDLDNHIFCKKNFLLPSAHIGIVVHDRQLDAGLHRIIVKVNPLRGIFQQGRGEYFQRSCVAANACSIKVIYYVCHYYICGKATTP